VEQLVLPNSVYDVMSARLARLGAAARQVADVIAVAGMATDHDVIGHVLRDGDRPLDGAALLSALDELRVAGIVVENADSGSVTYDMAHPMLRQAFSRASGAAREQALHARIATALEAWHGDKAERHAEQIAAHWRVADPKVNPRASVRWLLLAGRQAMERLARREAAAAFRAALKRADDYPDVVDAEAVPTLLDELSRLYRRLGEYQEAINVCTRARDLALAHGDEMAVALAERRLGLAHEASVNAKRRSSTSMWASRARARTAPPCSWRDCCWQGRFAAGTRPAE
jgi:tetratricopeptide (TPR) repeat protein